MRQAPLGHDGAAAADDAGDSLGGQRNIGQAHASVDGEIIHPLLGLLDQRVAEDFPGQLLGNAFHLFQRLIDRHGADGHGAVAQNPFAGVVNIAAGRQVHDGVGAMADGPHHLVNLVGDIAGHG